MTSLVAFYKTIVLIHLHFHEKERNLNGITIYEVFLSDDNITNDALGSCITGLKIVRFKSKSVIMSDQSSEGRFLHFYLADIRRFDPSRLS